MTQFLVIRYTPGAAGKLLTSLLSIHPEISSWNRNELDNLTWFKNSFSENLETWMDFEPQNPWNIKDYVSSFYPRGDNLETLPIDFENKWIPVIWHKNYLAKFIKNYHIVTIHIDNKSKKWYHRSRWKKHFKAEIKNKTYKVYQFQHKPNSQVRNFNNKYCVEVNNLFSFIKKNVIDYKDNFNFTNNTTDHLQTNINLSNLLEWESTKKSLEKISKDLNLKEFDWDCVENLWRHWRSCHKY